MLKKSDYIAIGAVVAVILLFCLPGALNGFINLTNTHSIIMSFLKFAVLATFGECIGLRITAGVYNRPGFGILPRAFVWGILGIGISLAFIIFIVGAPTALATAGLPVSTAYLANGTFLQKLLTSFCISLCINCIFAPIFMTLHKITDAHIRVTGGSLAKFFSPIAFTKHLQEIDWNSLWGFVFKKTIPFFWLPAHTITFILPPHFRVLFAAALGVVLGVFLAIAALKKH